MITTEAWVLPKGPRTGRGAAVPGELVLQKLSFPEPGDTEVLAEPLYGSWEGNMTHAIERQPVDICRLRREPEVVLGNSGVVRVLGTGAAVTRVREGDVALLVPVGEVDRFGFINSVLGFDAPGTLGMLARRIKLGERQLLPLPAGSRHSLLQWASMSIRYATAWANWEAAQGCWRALMSEAELPAPFVWGWGGGTAFAELDLARRHGCRVAMICSSDTRRRFLESHGIAAVDRREFPDLGWDPARQGDRSYQAAHRRSEGAFLKRVEEMTDGLGVSIFLENIGAPVVATTLKALGEPGVLSTVGWKMGPEVSTYRPAECMRRHIHVHTHAMRVQQMQPCMDYAEREGWITPVDSDVYPWEEIPRLAEDFAAGRLDTYFPLYQVNEV